MNGDDDYPDPVERSRQMGAAMGAAAAPQNHYRVEDGFGDTLLQHQTLQQARDYVNSQDAQTFIFDEHTDEEAH
jgi:hypothetical protein